MRAFRLRELRELLQGQPFAAWWTDLVEALAAEREARARAEELAAGQRLAELEAEAAQRLAIDTFSEAGEADEQAARLAAEAQSHEVRALELVARFEEQRFRTSDVWYRLGGAERAVELRREEISELAPRPQGDKARAQAEAALRLAERQLQGLQGEYAEEDRKRSQLWDGVETAWNLSFERSLLAAEHGTRSRRITGRAEQLFRDAEERRERSRSLREEAERVAPALAEQIRRRTGLLQAAAERFGCLAGEAFLYFRHPDDQRAAWAVALREEATGFNVPVRPLEVYLVHRAHGVALLRPAREGLPNPLERGRRRLAAGPRRGALRDRTAAEAEEP
ncbi:MAG TPA: hypothetical protein VMU15_22065 [Anaeromyxobacter sp.]|nr:hypothetical protein [Anaeromyxobacter sp.]